MRLVETNPMVFGGLPACLSAWASPLKQRIGDRMAGTTVVLSSYPYRRKEEAKEIDRRSPLA
ncbi:RDD family protein [Stieleria varia]|uniref:Uncharacterized protein n=1 Tax=Stieleria varia TaxID=2528005 RepID=A0A5C6A212_9BACT|nr:hypothetical protein [Stieleria varia]TWT93271.1 hypothetical protein Pla52n_59310 [Stieleria varia]